MKMNVLILLSLLLLGLFACSSDGTQTSDRLDSLDAEVKALKQEALAREKNLREELGQIRKILEGIQDVMMTQKGLPKAEGRSGAVEPDAGDDSLGRELDAKAKSFVNENLDRLFEITKKLLGKIEQELDKEIEKDEAQEVPDGERI